MDEEYTSELKERIRELEHENEQLQKSLRESGKRDVTEEYKKNQQIKGSKDFLETIFQSIQDGISVLNTDLSIRYVNHVMENWYAESMPLVGKKCYKAYHDSFVPCDPCPAVRCMKTKKTETEIVPGSPDPNSPVKWLELYSYPIMDSDSGEVKGVVEFVRDITQHVKDRDKLNSQKERLANIVEGTDAGTWEWNIQTGKTVFNERWAQFIGYTLEELSPTTIDTWMEFTHPEDLEKCKEELDKYFRGKTNLYECEHRMKHKDGSWIWLLARGKVVSWTEDGKPLWMFGTHQNITKRKETEIRLNKSEEKYRELFEGAPIGIFRTNSQGKAIMANSTMAHILGFSTPEESIAYYDNLAEQLYVDSQRRREFFQIVKDQGWVENFEYKAKRKDGKHIWLSMTAQVVTDKDDNDFVIDGFASDVTERKETERQLEESENFISALLNNLNVGVVACNEEGILTYFNKKTEEFHGLPQKNIPPEEWADYYDLYSEDGKTKLSIEEIPLYRALNGEYFNEIEMVIKPKEGDALSILNSGQPLKDTQGNITGAVVAMHDITDRKLKEKQLIELNQQLSQQNEEIASQNEEYEALNEELNEKNTEVQKSNTELKKAKEKAEESEKYFRLLISNAPYAIFIQTNWKFAYVNYQAMELFGAEKAEELIGKPVMERFHPDFHDKVRKRIVGLNQEKLFQPNIEEIYLKLDGTPVNVEVSAVPFRYGGEDGALVFVRDITDRKQAERQLQHNYEKLVATEKELKTSNEELQDLNDRLKKQKKEMEEAKEQAEESDRLKSAFLANMSHEIRTPMNSIMGFSELLQKKDTPKDKQKKFLDIIHSRTGHLLHIINDLVDVSKIEANQLTLEFQHFYLNDVMQELYSVFSNELESREKAHIQLRMSMGLNHEQSYIESDFNRFRQIMDNLLKNAVKYTREGTIEFGYEMQSENTLRFYVLDSGAGIPQDQQEHIFERFRQVGDSTARTQEGTGLGLTISKNLVEMMGGEMWMNSKEGEGSVFYFTLPYETKSNSENAETQQQETDVDESKDKTLLVIEDDPASREYLKELLEPHGFTLILCETGKDGYESFTNNPEIDLILLDLKLPDMDGLDIIRKIRSSSTNSKVPVIAQTAYAMSGDAQKSINAGCNDYISKPIDINQLLEKISKFI